MPELTEQPFIIEHRRIEEPLGKHTPEARVSVRAALRTSGLLSLLSDKHARVLLALLTYLAPNGQVQATAQQVGQALGVPTRLAALWLMALCARRFHGYHLVYRVGREEGHAVYCLSRAFVIQEQQPPPADAPQILEVMGREKVIARSRHAYATPRAEVEAGVMRRLGHAPEELLDTPEGAVWRGLHVLKIAKADIRALIDTYGAERILEQLEWLPERRAKNPAHFLIAALRHNFGPPKTLSDTLLSEEERRGQRGHSDE
jgi:hypothetical protein